MVCAVDTNQLGPTTKNFILKFIFESFALSSDWINKNNKYILVCKADKHNIA